jgi:hypothetical protein
METLEQRILEVTSSIKALPMLNHQLSPNSKEPPPLDQQICETKRKKQDGRASYDKPYS